MASWHHGRHAAPHRRDTRPMSRITPQQLHESYRLINLDNRNP